MGSLLEHSDDAMAQALERAREEHRTAEELFTEELQARSSLQPKVEAALAFFGSYSLLEIYSETLTECMRVIESIEENLREEEKLWKNWERSKRGIDNEKEEQNAGKGEVREGVEAATEVGVERR